MFNILVVLVKSLSFKMHHNGFALGAVGDLEAQNCQPAPMLNRSTDFQFCTSPPIAPNACYGAFFYFFYLFIYQEKHNVNLHLYNELKINHARLSFISFICACKFAKAKSIV